MHHTMHVVDAPDNRPNDYDGEKDGGDDKFFCRGIVFLNRISKFILRCSRSRPLSIALPVVLTQFMAQGSCMQQRRIEL